VVQFGGVKPIDGLTVTLKKPIVGLIGPNGAGKTTLLNVLSGFVQPRRGWVKVNGEMITGVPPHARAAFGLRRTFQTDQIAEDLTLLENVMAIADHAHFDSRDAMRKSVFSAIDFVGLSHRLHRKGDNLSTEERHLAEVAKALIGSPKLVMLDEPGAGMSGSESEHLQKVIKAIPGYCKAQVFLIDHDVDLIAACCHETMVLDFGKLLALGPTLEVLKKPEVQQAYLGNFDDLEVAA
jgi:ABC-type branched-subunit amino acid transport system ATPase component